MKIKEIFRTLQGEGRNWGMPSVFVRLGQCNLRCTFCDTDYLTNLKEMTPAQVVSEIVRVAGECRNIVFTGGEPLLQQNELVRVMDMLRIHSKLWYFAIETNGTVKLSEDMISLLDWVCCSPKVATNIKIQYADEVKVVFTKEYRPLLDTFMSLIESNYYYISPEAPSNNPYAKNKVKKADFQECVKYVMDNPKWRLNLQTHKILNIR